MGYDTHFPRIAMQFAWRFAGQMVGTPACVTPTTRKLEKGGKLLLHKGFGVLQERLFNVPVKPLK